jgi:hypothetical protein
MSARGAPDNSVYAVTSGDGGRSWNLPVRVSDDSETPAVEIRSAIGGSGVIHVVWVQNLAQGARLWHRTVGARGRGPSFAFPDTLRGMVNRLQLALDGCGVLHAIFDLYLADGPWLHAARFDKRGWASDGRPFRTLHAFAPSVRTQQGSVYIAAVITDSAAAGHAARQQNALAQLHTRLSPPESRGECCE